jgi:hypothetical protein
MVGLRDNGMVVQSVGSRAVSLVAMLAVEWAACWVVQTAPALAAMLAVELLFRILCRKSLSDHEFRRYKKSDKTYVFEKAGLRVVLSAAKLAVLKAVSMAG